MHKKDDLCRCYVAREHRFAISSGCNPVDDAGSSLADLGRINRGRFVGRKYVPIVKEDILQRSRVSTPVIRKFRLSFGFDTNEQDFAVAAAPSQTENLIPVLTQFRKNAH